MLALILAAALAEGQPAAAAPTRNPDICAAASACRLVPSVELHDVKGRTFNIKIDERVPWLDRGTLMIFNNEAVVVSLADDGAGKLKQTVVATGETAKTHALQTGELLIQFAPSADKAYELKIDSRYPKWLKYQAIIGGPDAPPHDGGVSPIRPNARDVESYQNPLVQIALSNFAETAGP